MKVGDKVVFKYRKDCKNSKGEKDQYWYSGACQGDKEGEITNMATQYCIVRFEERKGHLNTYKMKPSELILKFENNMIPMVIM